MGVLREQRMSVDEFVEWWQAQPGKTKFELDQGRVVALSPETVRHANIKANARDCLREAIAKADLDCHAYPDGPSIRIDGDTLREPDASAQCGQSVDEDSIFLDTPIVVVEVISPSSTRRDTISKVDDYFRVESIMHYLILDPKSRSVVWHARSADAGKIATTVVKNGDITLAPPSLTSSVEALFDGVSS